MSDKIKHKQVTKKTNHKIADPKANDSVCLFFAAAHFLKTILAIPHLANEVLLDILAATSKTKRAIFCQRNANHKLDNLKLTDR